MCLSVTIRYVNEWSVVWVTLEIYSYVPYPTVPSWVTNLKMPTTSPVVLVAIDLQAQGFSRFQAREFCQDIFADGDGFLVTWL